MNLILCTETTSIYFSLISTPDVRALGGAAFHVVSQGLGQWKRPERTISRRFYRLFLEGVHFLSTHILWARTQAHATPNGIRNIM